MKTNILYKNEKRQERADKALCIFAVILLACFNRTVHAVPLVPKLLPAFCDTASLEAFPELPRSLKCNPPPEPYILDANGVKNSIYPDIVKNKAALIALGKMLFWDSNVGSDGIACASCHFHAGADNRFKNQINPGMRNASGEFASNGTTPIGNVFNFMATSPLIISTPFISFPDPMPAAVGKGPNYTLKKNDFPLTKYLESANPVAGEPLQADRHAEVVFDTDDVISSSGVYPSKYMSLNAAGRKEVCEKTFPIAGVGMPFFNVAGHTVRQVAPRNTPSVINAVYNFRNFWDGRANNVFNGLDPFGMRRFMNPDKIPKSEIYVKKPDGTIAVKRISILNASLASQAVGPALSDVEMSCADKNFHELGRKLIKLIPLSNQFVDLTDSVLGTYSRFPLKGTKGLFNNYKNTIKLAFNDAFWNIPDTTLTPEGYTLMENNFSLFWGLAIQAYESTLVSDDTRFDQSQEDPENSVNILTEQERRGLGIFMSKGNCVACHSGSEFTGASVNHVSNAFNRHDEGRYVERMVMGDGGIALYDSGFYNIGVRPSVEDLGVGESDPYGFPLSFSLNAKKNVNDPANFLTGNNNLTYSTPDPFLIDTDFMDSTAGCVAWNPTTTVSGYLCGNGPVVSDERVAVDGAFKTPSLRNVELTGPYFHNGGQSTLDQVVRFYNRGGDRKDLFQKKQDCGEHEPVMAEDEFGNPIVTADAQTGLVDTTGLSKDSNLSTSNVAPDIAGTRDPFESHCDQAHEVNEVVEVTEPIVVEEPLLPGEIRKPRPPEVKLTKTPQTLGLTQQEVDDLVAFMKSLTDERVRLEQAPFDHPSLVIPHGHVGNEVKVNFNATTNQAAQQTFTLPAVGAGGRSAVGLLPIPTFDAALK
ncbi:MAG: hypothetical protein IPN42_06405 [Methylococcaceae bacterium]|nr:hypothetical protein [Methylococcaceae bacterium]